jgi:hypothetical protein
MHAHPFTRRARSGNGGETPIILEYYGESKSRENIVYKVDIHVMDRVVHLVDMMEDQNAKLREMEQRYGYNADRYAHGST